MRPMFFRLAALALLGSCSSQAERPDPHEASSILLELQRFEMASSSQAGGHSPAEATRQRTGRFDMAFRSGRESPQALTVNGDGLSLRVSLEGAAESAGQEIDQYRVFANGYGDANDVADVVHRIESSGIEDFVLFRKAPRASQLRYHVSLDAGIAGLRLVANTLEFLDASGTPKLRVDSPYVIDSNHRRLPAQLRVQGCAVDTDPRGPWGREPVAPGSKSCVVQVDWDSNIAYPAVVDPRWARTGDPLYVGTTGTSIAKLNDGRVLHVSGSLASIFDPTTETWSATSAPPQSINGPAAFNASLNRVLVVETALSDLTFLFDVAAGTWSSGPTLPIVVQAAQVVSVPGTASRFRVVTGTRWPSCTMNNTILIDLDTNSASLGAATPYGCIYAAAVAQRADLQYQIIDGTFAGHCGSTQARNFTYNAVTDSFSAAATPPRPGENSAAGRDAAGNIVLIGGGAGCAQNTPYPITAYNPSTDTWTAPLAPPTRPHGASADTGKNSVLTSGGELIFAAIPEVVFGSNYSSYTSGRVPSQPTDYSGNPGGGGNILELNDGRVLLVLQGRSYLLDACDAHFGTPVGEVVCGDGRPVCDATTSRCIDKLANDTAIPANPNGEAPFATGTCSALAGSTVCASGVCDAGDNRCGFANGSGPCNGSNGSSVCRSGTCSASGLCMAAGTCLVDADCAGATPFCSGLTRSCQATPLSNRVVYYVAGQDDMASLTELGQTPTMPPNFRVDSTLIEFAPGDAFPTANNNASRVPLCLSPGTHTLVSRVDDAYGGGRGYISVLEMTTGTVVGGTTNSIQTDRGAPGCPIYVFGEAYWNARGMNSVWGSTACSDFQNVTFSFPFTALDEGLPCVCPGGVSVCRYDPCNGVTCDDGNECTADGCSGGSCSTTIVPARTMCSTGFCNGDALSPACVSCLDASDCSGTSPVCAGAACAACDGNFGTSSMRPCPDAAAPTCQSQGASAGACFRCMQNSDCLVNPQGDVCEVSSGLCGNVCTSDLDCGQGRFCAATNVCVQQAANGQPVPNVSPLDGVCSLSSGMRGCISGVCSALDNLCGANLGETCANAGVCRSDVCTSNNVCAACDATHFCPPGQQCGSDQICESNPDAAVADAGPDAGFDGGTLDSSMVDAGLDSSVDANGIDAARRRVGQLSGSGCTLFARGNTSTSAGPWALLLLAILGRRQRTKA